MTPPNIVDVIAMYRELRNWSFDQARDFAIEEYRRKKWPIPAAIENLYNRQSRAVHS
jgi:hypothetical protein